MLFDVMVAGAARVCRQRSECLAAIGGAVHVRGGGVVYQVRVIGGDGDTSDAVLNITDVLPAIAVTG